MEVHHLGDVVVLITNNKTVYTLTHERCRVRGGEIIRAVAAGDTQLRSAFVLDSELEKYPWEKHACYLIDSSHWSEFRMVQFENTSKSS